MSSVSPTRLSKQTATVAELTRQSSQVDVLNTSDGSSSMKSASVRPQLLQKHPVTLTPHRAKAPDSVGYTGTALLHRAVHAAPARRSPFPRFLESAGEAKTN